MTTALALDDELPVDAWADGFGPDFDPDWPARETGRRRSTARPSVLDAGTVGPADLVRPIDELARRSVPALPVAFALRPVLPDGLRRGSTVAVTRSMSLLLALLGAPSVAGAWCALVGMPPISAEAAVENGIELARLALVPAPGSGWLTAVGALLDAMDVVAVRPPASVSDGDIRRLSARARSRGSILMPYLAGQDARGQRGWPRADVNLEVEGTRWTGLGTGHGRLHARQVTVKASGRGSAARPRATTCWLPSTNGGIADLGPAVAVPLHSRRSTDPLAG